MNFLFKVVTSCSRIPKAKPSFNRQTGCRQGDSHFALLLLHLFSVFYFSRAITYKETSIVSYPFGKLPLQPPTRCLRRKPHPQVAACRSCAPRFPLPWAVPYAPSARATLLPPDRVMLWVLQVFVISPAGTRQH